MAQGRSSGGRRNPPAITQADADLRTTYIDEDNTVVPRPDGNVYLADAFNRLRKEYESLLDEIETEDTAQSMTEGDSVALTDIDFSALRVLQNQQPVVAKQLREVRKSFCDAVAKLFSAAAEKHGIQPLDGSASAASVDTELSCLSSTKDSLLMLLSEVRGQARHAEEAAERRGRGQVQSEGELRAAAEESSRQARADCDQLRAQRAQLTTELERVRRDGEGRIRAAEKETAAAAEALKQQRALDRAAQGELQAAEAKAGLRSAASDPLADCIREEARKRREWLEQARADLADSVPRWLGQSLKMLREKLQERRQRREREAPLAAAPTGADTFVSVPVQVRPAKKSAAAGRASTVQGQPRPLGVRATVGPDPLMRHGSLGSQFLAGSARIEAEAELVRSRSPLPSRSAVRRCSAGAGDRSHAFQNAPVQSPADTRHAASRSTSRGRARPAAGAAGRRPVGPLQRVAQRTGPRMGERFAVPPGS
eukprot:TRINITY_DN27331_c0_g1_i1.p1 TRINITY_DN27331_c0_g1~~TRINITY_DN27331_c0_g1_i1.p1  ORF type:complete len:513 (+),score=102.49 TRINITY_DN27331_c0_g1_i1:91-1539(+)